MKYKEIGLGLGRSVRLEPYNVIRPEVRLVVELEPDDDVDKVIDELKVDLNLILDELEEDEAFRQGFVKDIETGTYIKVGVRNEIRMGTD